MAAIVKEVLEDSIAQDLGLVFGDEIISINGEKPQDYIDYQFMTASEELDLHIKHQNGNEEIFEIEKDFDEDLGIVFQSAVFDKVKPCTNHCIFCFVDQQPKGLRDTLYVKDDDYRLSYLQGTYVTLTNLTAKDRKRLEQLRLGPLYVSVHTTNPELRVKMLKNPKAAGILEELKWLNSLDIPVHTQIVLCPDYNDKEELKKTLNDLAALENVQSIAIVPLGLTKYRENNDLKPVDKDICLETIAIIENFNAKIKKNLASASDEFYIMAEKSIPNAKYYNNYAQLDDGVGATRILLEDFKKLKKQLPVSIKKPKKLVFATGLIAKDTLQIISDELNKIKNLETEVVAVESIFWGESITVSGLITGQDIENTFKDREDKNYELIIPAVMLKSYTDRFLDDKTLVEVSKNIGVKINVIKDFYSTKEFLDLIKN